MNDNLRCKLVLRTIVASLSLAAMPAYSQQPTSAQRDAIRSACRADYEAHCASVAPGGAASLQCLQQNMSALSSACQMAVRTVEPVAEPATENKAESKPEAAPVAVPSKPAADAAPPPAAKMNSATPAPQPSSAQVAAIRSACRSDYPKVCAGVPTGGAAALQCLEQNRTKLSASCEKAVAAASGGAAPAAAPAKEGAAAAAPGAAPAAAPAVIVLRAMRPREELLVLRSACGGDARSVCGAVQPGGGRVVQCLAQNAGSLSPACKEVLAPFAAR